MTQLPPLAPVPAWPAGSSTYPGTLDALHATEYTGTFSKEINDLTAAVTAIESTLGSTPAGSYPSIKAALIAVQTTLATLQTEIDNITAVPGPPNTFYRFTQAVPASLWDITHSLGRKAAVTVTDSAGTPVEGEVEYVSNDRLTITFSSPFAGEATLT